MLNVSDHTLVNCICDPYLSLLNILALGQTCKKMYQVCKRFYLNEIQQMFEKWTLHRCYIEAHRGNNEKFLQYCYDTFGVPRVLFFGLPDNTVYICDIIQALIKDDVDKLMNVCGIITRYGFDDYKRIIIQALLLQSWNCIEYLKHERKSHTHVASMDQKLQRGNSSPYSQREYGSFETLSLPRVDYGYFASSACNFEQWEKKCSELGVCNIKDYNVIKGMLFLQHNQYNAFKNLNITIGKSLNFSLMYVDDTQFIDLLTLQSDTCMSEGLIMPDDYIVSSHDLGNKKLQAYLQQCIDASYVPRKYDLPKECCDIQ